MRSLHDAVRYFPAARALHVAVPPWIFGRQEDSGNDSDLDIDDQTQPLPPSLSVDEPTAGTDTGINASSTATEGAESSDGLPSPNTTASPNPIAAPEVTPDTPADDGSTSLDPSSVAESEGTLGSTQSASTTPLTTESETVAEPSELPVIQSSTSSASTTTTTPVRVIEPSPVPVIVTPSPVNGGSASNGLGDEDTEDSNTNGDTSVDEGEVEDVEENVTSTVPPSQISDATPVDSSPQPDTVPDTLPEALSQTEPEDPNPGNGEVVALNAEVATDLDLVPSPAEALGSVTETADLASVTLINVGSSGSPSGSSPSGVSPGPQPTETNESSGLSGSLSGGQIAGVVIGSLALCAIIAVALLIGFRRWKNRQLLYKFDIEKQMGSPNTRFFQRTTAANPFMDGPADSARLPPTLHRENLSPDGSPGPPRIMTELDTQSLGFGSATFAIPSPFVAHDSPKNPYSPSPSPVPSLKKPGGFGEGRVSYASHDTIGYIPPPPQSVIAAQGYQLPTVGQLSVPREGAGVVFSFNDPFVDQDPFADRYIPPEPGVLDSPVQATGPADRLYR